MVCVLGGCAHVMSDAGLALADRSISYSDIKNNINAVAGKTIMVGGIIAGTHGNGDVLRLEVAQLELHSNGVPDELSTSAGRFMVVSGELLDPLFYRPGFLVTVIGEVKGQQLHKLNGADYRYPVISAKEIRLFPLSDSPVGRQTNPYQNQIGDERFMHRPPGGL